MEIHSLFTGYIYTDNKVPREQAKHWHFWLPLLSYYTGAYSDEIGNLTLSDIVTLQGIDCFYFHTNDKIKSRYIPIHTTLVSAGFLDFIEYVKKHSHCRLMFDLPKKSGRYSEKVRIWFSGEGKRLGYLQKCDLLNVDNEGKKLAISSLRLNFEQQIRFNTDKLQNHDAFLYLLGFNKYTQQTYADTKYLSQVIEKLRPLSPQITWHRFVHRA